jgi:F-type H+-transporting ATPase subunit alpha
VPVDKVHNFETEYLFYLRQNHAQLLANLKAGKLLDEDLATMRQVAADLSAKYAK